MFSLPKAFSSSLFLIKKMKHNMYLALPPKNCERMSYKLCS